jgi:hypothetical protein
MKQELTPPAEGYWMRNRYYFVLLAMSLCTTLLGCGGGGGDTAHLQGAVTIGGQPIPAEATGSITFDPAQAGPAAKTVTVTIEGGRYDSPETPLGSVRAVFNVQAPDGPEYTTDRGVKARNIKNIVPEKSQAGVSIEVTGDNPNQDFDL